MIKIQSYFSFKYYLTFVLPLLLDYVKYTFIPSYLRLTSLPTRMQIRTYVRRLDIFSLTTFSRLTSLAAPSYLFSIASWRTWFFVPSYRLTSCSIYPPVFLKALKLKLSFSPNVLISAIVRNACSKTGVAGRRVDISASLRRFCGDVLTARDILRGWEVEHRRKAQSHPAAGGEDGLSG